MGFRRYRVRGQVAVRHRRLTSGLVKVERHVLRIEELRAAGGRQQHAGDEAQVGRVRAVGLVGKADVCEPPTPALPILDADGALHPENLLAILVKRPTGPKDQVVAAHRVVEVAQPRDLVGSPQRIVKEPVVANGVGGRLVWIEPLADLFRPALFQEDALGLPHDPPFATAVSRDVRRGRPLASSHAGESSRLHLPGWGARCLWKGASICHRGRIANG